MNFMRRLCMGGNKMLQDILREQKLNRVSINFFEETVKYLIASELVNPTSSTSPP